MNKRQMEILQYLIEERYYHPIHKLAASFKVSDRTIRYDVDEIEYFITKCSSATVVRKYKEGIFVEAQQEDVQRIKAALKKKESREWILDGDDKCDQLVIFLLMCEEPVSMDVLAQQMNVGKTTAYALLNKAEAYFSQHQIRLIRKGGKGISIRASEDAWRKCMKQLLMSKIHLENFFDLVTYSKFFSQENLDASLLLYSDLKDSIFKEIDLKGIYDSLVEAQKNGIYLADVSLLSVWLLLIIIVKRTSLRHYIEQEFIRGRVDRNGVEYRFACEISENLMKTCNIRISSNEVDYLAENLMLEKKMVCNIDQDSEYVNYALKLIFQVQNDLGHFIPVTESFLKDLVIHLKPAIVRASQQTQHSLENPLLETIKGKYEELFLSVRHACQQIHADHPTFPVLSDDEIGYLTMHIGSLLHIAHPSQKQCPRLLLVCSEGIAVSKMLSVRITEEFPTVKIAQASIHELQQLDLNTYDLVLSTFPIPLRANIPFLKVDPVLKQRDIENISTLLNIRSFYFAPKQRQGLEVYQDILTIIENNCYVKNRAELDKAIKKVLKIDEKREDKHYMLSDLITEKRICIGYRAADWEDAVRKAGSLLMEDDCCDEGYVNAMVETVKELGPYIVVAKGIALPHAKPEAGSKEVGMSLVILKNEICFGSKQNDPVRAVFGLCAVDGSSHIQALSDLGTFAMDEQSFHTLLNLNETKQIMNYIYEVCHSTKKEEF